MHVKENKVVPPIRAYLPARPLSVVSIVVPFLLLAGIFWLTSVAAQPAELVSPAPLAIQAIHVEFPYSGDDPIAAAAAAEEFASLLTVETGLDVKASTFPCAADVARHLGTGQVDVAPLSAIAYVQERDTYGLVARLANVTAGSTSFRGQINILASSGYSAVGDLQGTTFAAPTSTSMSAYYAPYVLISDTTGLKPEQFFGEIVFTGSHGQVIRDVYSGRVHSGATYSDARLALVDELPDVLNVVDVLTETQPIPNSPWVFRADLDPSTTLVLTDGLIAVAGTTEGQDALEPLIRRVEGVAPISEALYDLNHRVVQTFGLRERSCNENFLPTLFVDED